MMVVGSGKRKEWKKKEKEERWLDILLFLQN